MLRIFICLSLCFFSQQGVSDPVFKRQNSEIAKSLDTDVKFWESIFSKYERSHCVYHDSKNLDAVFWVSTIQSKNRRLANRQIKRQKMQIKAALGRLAKGHKSRSWLDKRISSQLPSHLQNRQYYAGARDRVRCQRGVASNFRQSLVRSEKYMAMIKAKFASQGLPSGLSYLPHLESGFNAKAKSKVGARGLWQLMPATARQFLKVNRYRDERIHPYKSTLAAARILKTNFEKTRSWPLAITAYNYGINGMMRAVRKYQTKDYLTIRERHKTRIFGFAAKNFYPSFIAVKNLASKHEQRLAAANLQSASHNM